MSTTERQVDHLPIIHLNGTSKQSLLEQLEEVYLALSAALDAMRKASPNGRDYYPQPGRMEKALLVHRRRMLGVSSLMVEVERDVHHIHDGGY
jgi:hypothetical protein